MVSFGKWLAIAFLAVVIVFFSINPQSAPVNPDLTFQKLLAALGGIFVIVLLVERVTEIVVTIWRQPTSEQLKEELTLLKADPKKAAEAEAKAKQVAKYQAETKGFAILFSFTLSVIVCSAGVGLLREVIDVTKGNANFLRGVDIVLTSGLIAGGSDSFHQFVRALETFFTQSKERMENKP
jgi:hypothetical protein